jgi:hypothetical protein
MQRQQLADFAPDLVVGGVGWLIGHRFGCRQCHRLRVVGGSANDCFAYRLPDSPSDFAPDSVHDHIANHNVPDRIQQLPVWNICQHVVRRYVHTVPCRPFLQRQQCAFSVRCRQFIQQGWCSSV